MYFKTLSFIALLSFSALSHAVMIFDVSSATGTNASCPHGLWTSGDSFTGACGNRFDIDATLTVNGTTNATLIGTASNGTTIADIDLTFFGFAEEYNYKKEGGADYNPANVDFFTTVLGSITIDRSIYDIDGFAGGYGFQYGLGASAKNPDVMGASAWIRSCQDDASVPFATDCMSSHHWDLNLDITAVPEPSVIALFAVGLLGMGFARRRKS